MVFRCLGFRVFGFRVFQSLGFRIFQGLGFRVPTVGSPSSTPVTLFLLGPLNQKNGYHSNALCRFLEENSTFWA